MRLSAIADLQSVIELRTETDRRSLKERSAVPTASYAKWMTYDARTSERVKKGRNESPDLN